MKNKKFQVDVRSINIKKIEFMIEIYKKQNFITRIF